MITKAINITNQSIQLQNNIIKALSIRMLRPLIIIAMTLFILTIVCQVTENMVIGIFAFSIAIVSIILLFIIRKIFIRDTQRLINKKNTVYEFHIKDTSIKAIHDHNIYNYSYKSIKRCYVINNHYLAILITKYRYYLLNLETFLIGDREVLLSFIHIHKIRLIALSIPS